MEGIILKENDGAVNQGMQNGSWRGKTTDPTPPILGGATNLHRIGVLFLKLSVRYLFFTGPF